MTYLKRTATLVAALAFSATAASAAPIIFFGEDLNANSSFVAGGNAETARNDFLSNLTGVSTEDFESFAAGTSNPGLSFSGTAGAINATLSGAGFVLSGSGSGRFATSGSKSYQTTAGGDFSITFNTGVSAFGFYGTDIGDFNNQLVLGLSGGGSETINIGNQIGAPNGSLLFFGFIDPTNSYTSISFDNSGGDVDIFGFDDLVVGDRGQVTLDPVPLPASAMLLLAGFGGLAALRRKKA